MVMRERTTDFSILEELGFALPPVGVKFELFEPEGIEPLAEPVAMCEMIRVAQKADAPFYMYAGNESCMGKGAMGMMGDDEPAWAKAGLIGERMGIFRDAGANMRCMQNYTLFKPGSVNYVVFAPLPCLDFEPDLMIFAGPMQESGTIMRAMAYSTGLPFKSTSTAVFQCSWLFSYPQLTGEVNYIPMGMGHGTTAREIYEPGEIVVSVPSPWFPVILQNLAEMEVVPSAWEMGRDKWLVEEEGIYGKLAQDTAAAGL